eukprot:scaffold3210_cov402-Prasinococcus_capsulatus_cf.AAC.6
MGSSGQLPSTLQPGKAGRSYCSCTGTTRAALLRPRCAVAELRVSKVVTPRIVHLDHVHVVTFMVTSMITVT